jgi:glycosyltransferase involved in cell wall biosynthesis
MPGLVGLVIVDSFVTATPLVTVDVPYHSPEISYLDNNENGLILPASTRAEDYGRRVAELLTDEGLLSHLRSGCRESSAIYTLENMVCRYAEGISTALGNPTDMASR